MGLIAYLPSIASLGQEAPTLRAVYSRSQKSAQECATEAAHRLNLAAPPSIYHDGDSSTNLDALLQRQDISAVIIVLPITLQPSIIMKALAAGKHVLSEKPVSKDVAEGLKLIEEFNVVYKPKGLVWRVAEDIEAEPGYRGAAKAIREGKIGKVIFFNARVVNYIDKSSRYYKTPWRTVPDVRGSLIYSKALSADHSAM